MTFQGLGLATSTVVLGMLPVLAADFNFGMASYDFSISATDRARVIGLGIAPGALADSGGSVYQRSADRDATYLHFDLSPLVGTTINGDVNLNFTVDAYWGGAINNGIIGTPAAAWSFPGNAPGISTFTSVAAPNRNYTSGETATWTIGNATFSGLLGSPANFHGLAVTAGAGSTAHFSDAPITLTGNHTAPAIRVRGGSDWSAASWNDGSKTLVIGGSSTVSGGNIRIATGTTLSVTDAATLGGGAFSGTIDNGGTLAMGSSANQTLGGAISGSGALTKSGTGTLTLTTTNTHSGGTTVNGGTLTLDGASFGNARIRGALTVNQGGTVNFTNGDGTALGWNNGARVTSLAINGGTVTSPGIIHVWNFGSNLTLAGGTLQSNNGTSSTTGPSLEWAGTTLTTQASANSSVIAGRVRFRPDAGTVHTIEVADGAAATDLLVSAALTETSRSNLLKTGSGTLRITGAVELTGVITVEAGTLDFAPSAVSPSLRIAVADGARVNLSNSAATLVKNVYVGGQRLATGTWGAPGSGAANQSSAFTGSGILQVTDTDISNRERWKRMKYGQFTHYVWDGSGVVTRMPDGSASPSIDYVANNFDAPKFADDLESMGVEYVIFTAWHANFNPLFNCAAFDRYGYGYRRSQRDMLGDMIAAVKAKGIRVLFYTHPNQPIDFNWWTHNNMINDVYAELIDRYGDQIDGMFMDENNPSGDQDSMVDFVRLERTIRRRNPDLMLIQNFYGNLYTFDLPMGESGPTGPWFSKDIAGASFSSYAQVMSNTWSAQVPESQFAATRSPEGIFRAAVMAAGSCTDGGGTAWAAGPYPGGRWEQGVLEAMQGAGQLMAPVAEAIKHTYPSTSWPTPAGTWIGSLPQGIVATRSPDDTNEYIHVLNPPTGSTLVLPSSADGKMFANARLLTNGQAVTMEQSARALKLTLTGANTWDANDTVIVMDVVSSGDRYLANNTSPDATYTGSWVHSGNRPTSEFRRDVHSTTANGDFVEYAFNGTDIELLVSCGPNRGSMEIYLDGVFQRSVSAIDATDGLRKTIYHGSGLPRGNHTLKVVKTSGSVLAIDAFRATEFIDSTDPDVAYQALTLFNNTNTTANGVGYIEYDGNWSWQQRDRREYYYDAHWAVANGATFRIHFNGTGVQFVGTKDGLIDFYLDGVYLKRVAMGSFGSLDRNIGIDIKGLPAGNHTLTGVKVGDTYCLVDAFFVYNGESSAWSSQSDSTALGGTYQRSSAYGDAATLAFQGTGIEVIAPHQISGGTVAVSIQGSGYQDVAGQFVNQYAGEARPRSLSFASGDTINLPPGDYRLGMSHNRSFGGIALDAFRVYKNRPDSGPALKWGASGAGGSGTWNTNSTANWWDGTSATPWYDLGATDYSAEFSGTAGTVNLATTVTVNHLSFKTTGYTLQGNSVRLNGSRPLVTVANGATATLASVITGSNGVNKQGAGVLKLTSASSYDGGTVVNAGTLELSGASGGTGLIRGTVTVNAGATLAITGGDGSGFGWSNTVGTLIVNGGTVNAPGGSHVGFGAPTSIALNHGGSISGNWQWNGDGALSFSSSGNATNTLSGNLVLRSDAGANHTFNVADGSAATDLQVDANLSDQSPEVWWIPGSNLIKTGAGTMVLGGTSTYNGATVVNQGVLSLTGSVQSTSSVQIAAGAEFRHSGALQVSGSVTNSGTLVFSGAATLSVGGTITNYGTIINSSPSFVLPAGIINYGAIISPPGVPVSLTATPSGTSAVLGWTAVSGASSYRVKSATSASGPFTLIGSPTSNTFTISGLTTGTTYYFVVSAVNAAGEGSNSAAASCTIVSQLPLPWATADIGPVGIAGSASAAGGIYTVSGSGTGVNATSDQFRLVSQNSSGDCQIIARVDSLTASSSTAKAGVMIRESLAANSRCAGVCATPSSGVQFIWRNSTGGTVSVSTAAGLTAPRWVRLQRVGNSFRAFHSSNGTSWTQFGGNRTISMAASAHLGQAVTSGTNSSLCTGVLSNVRATP